DRQHIEEYLCDNDIDYQWTPDGALRTWSIRPGVMRHPVTGEMHWFNQANLWHVTNVDERHRKQLLDRCGIDNLPTHAYYGDGTPIDDADLDRVRKVMWDEAAIFPWKQGDVLILDNYLVAHGRMPYSGPRKILVAMG
ncbi:MAG: TauD/TfdA family dioxygenase, partial [Planctomycetales bacterium]